MPLNSEVMPIYQQNGGNTANTPISSRDFGASQKSSLTRISAIDVDDEEAKKLSRGISRTAENAGVISEIRKEVCASLAEVDETSSPSNSQGSVLETNDCTFSLPDLSNQSEEFRAFLESELIDTSMLISLQEAARLNWWTCLGEGCERLWPLSTTGDGNCLLHAASLGMWGFHDRLLILRKALHNFLTMGTCRHALWRRWRWQNARANLQAGLDLTLNEEEWKKEWDSILKLSSSQPRSSGSSTPCAGESETDGCKESYNSGSKTYESLEEIHVLALAHVLKRPIFVIADTVLKDVNGEALAPIPFGGIYLPLEIEPSECSRSPLVLAYDSAHFSSLVAMSKKKPLNTGIEPPAVIPLVDVDRELLPIQFEVDPGEGCVWNRDELNEATVQRIALTHEDRLALLNQFLDLVDIPCPAFIKHNNTKGQKKYEVKPISNQLRSTYDPEGWNSDNEYGGVRCISTGSKTPGKQLHSVAKQFGSLGRSVGRRIKKNLIENFTVRHQHSSTPSRASDTQWECPDFILCARLHTEKHHPCLEQMISNYLQSARQRFEQQQAERQRQTLVWQRKKQHTLAEVAVQEGPSPCINPDCTMYGTALTSYMCTGCYTKQLEQEEERAKSLKSTLPRSPSGNQNALYGTGKSVFYAQSDSRSHADAANIPARRPPTGQNGTLHLSNSTFYNDIGSAFYSPNSPKREEKIVFEKINPDIADKLKRFGSVKPGDVNQKLDSNSPELKNGTLSPSELLVDLGSNSSKSPIGVTQSAGASASSGDDPSLASMNPRLLSHYDSIRKRCKSNGCSSYGTANTQWFCQECFYIRTKAALARENILDGMKAAQMQ